jgi:hypothetical protein
VTNTPRPVGSLTAAINALNDGDRITFNISPQPGGALHPDASDGITITKNDITIDGYTQVVPPYVA